MKIIRAVTLVLSIPVFVTVCYFALGILFQSTDGGGIVLPFLLVILYYAGIWASWHYGRKREDRSLSLTAFYLSIVPAILLILLIVLFASTNGRPFGC